MSAAPVATQYSYEFVRRHLPVGAAKVLEIGCGAGEMAARLVADGLQVLALDSDESCAAEAKAAGVDARLATWPAPIEGKFDAVLFTRSLHHIAPLDEAVAAAVGVLRPGGRLIVEDFRIEATSARTDAWFTGLVRLLDAGGLFRSGSEAAAILDKLDFGEHRHELHSSTAMAEALGRHGTLHQEDAAYYFRYAEGAVAKGLSPLLLDYERSMIEAGAIDPLGRRFVLTVG